MGPYLLPAPTPPRPSPPSTGEGGGRGRSRAAPSRLPPSSGGQRCQPDPFSFLLLLVPGALCRRYPMPGRHRLPAAALTSSSFLLPAGPRRAGRPGAPAARRHLWDGDGDRRRPAAPASIPPPCPLPVTAALPPAQVPRRVSSLPRRPQSAALGLF